MLIDRGSADFAQQQNWLMVSVNKDAGRQQLSLRVTVLSSNLYKRSSDTPQRLRIAQGTAELSAGEAQYQAVLLPTMQDK